jgi:hypothetical protein
MKNTFYNRITGARRRYLEQENKYLTSQADVKIEQYVESMVKEMKIDFTQGSFEVWGKDPLITKCAELFVDMISHTPEARNFLTLRYASREGERFEVIVQRSAATSLAQIAGDSSAFLRSIDFEMLRHQKQMLMELSPANAHRIQLDARDGIINMIDSLQDLAIELNYTTEKEAFNLTEN